MAPEVLCKQGHSYGADYYAVGIITYELMLGRRPYNGVNRSEIKEQVLSKQFQLKPEDVPQGWNKEAADFVNRVTIASRSSS